MDSVQASKSNEPTRAKSAVRKINYRTFEKKKKEKDNSDAAANSADNLIDEPISSVNGPQNGPKDDSGFEPPKAAPSSQPRVSICEHNQFEIR